MKIHELGHVVLFVRSLEQSANFYRDTLGFNEVHRASGMALYSGGRTHHELLLIEVGGSMLPRLSAPAPGLYHIGFKIGDGADAARGVYRELVDRGVPIVGTGDHTVTHSIYILDPDGNEIELYADIGDAWKENPGAILTPVRSLRLE